MATKAEISAGSGAFNKVASWLYQARHGKHDVRRAEMLARVATFPGGAELLKQAEALGCGITVVPKKEIGAEGDFLNNSGKLGIRIANTGNPAGMAIALWHELRHMQQDAANPDGGFAHAGQLKNARVAHLMGMMIEADAFTAETLMALQQRKAGKPEYYDAMFKDHGYEPGVHRDIRRFLRDRPYENFKDDATFARSLFTHLMTDGMLAYRARYFSRIGMPFAAARDLGDFQKLVDASKEGGTNAGPELTQLYGTGYTSVSSRALATVFLKAQPEDEQQALALVDKTVKRAHRLTEQEFQRAKTEIVSRMQELYFKDPDEIFFPSKRQERARKALHQAAAQEQPPAIPVIWGPRK